MLHPSLPQPPFEVANPIREPPINYSFTQLPLQVSPSLPLPSPNSSLTIELSNKPPSSLLLCYPSHKYTPPSSIRTTPSNHPSLHQNPVQERDGEKREEVGSSPTVALTHRNGP
ncbi:hypothetical protein V6N11_080045 [Hibiscus sabdariffa]|uniref:Uncharacterized protein n=1 Tax=Hibiscus sabdariffa TaxID=183260 RepID=A0ABR2RXD4_9ROSI